MWKRIDRCITGSLCFSSETNTTLQINGTSVFFLLVIKEKKSITSYSHWFLRKIWPRTWPFLILIRERNELTTLAASTNKNLEKPVCSPQSAASPVSRACYLSTYRTATREKLGRREETQLLSEQGGCKFCSPRSVPSPGSTRTGGHSNTPREPLTQDRPGQEVGCNREHRGAQLQTPESAPPPHAQHQHHRVNTVLVHPCIQPTDGNTLRCWKPAGLLHAEAQAPCAETCRTLRSSSPAPRPLLQAPLTVLRKAASSVTALPPRLLPTSYLADPTDSRDDSWNFP